MNLILIREIKKNAVKLLYPAFGKFDRFPIVKNATDQISIACNFLLVSTLWVLALEAAQESVLMEGAFLDPNLLKDKGRMILVITSEEEQHKNQFFEHREKNEANLEEFKAARIIQDFLINEAKNLNVEIKENE